MANPGNGLFLLAPIHDLDGRTETDIRRGAVRLPLSLTSGDAIQAKGFSELAEIVKQIRYHVRVLTFAQ